MNHSHVLVFHGDGGIGKTSLLNELRRYSESESQLSILYDFHQYTQVYLKHMLFALGNSIYHSDKSYMSEKRLAEVVECISGIMWVIAGRENLSNMRRRYYRMPSL